MGDDLTVEERIELLSHHLETMDRRLAALESHIGLFPDRSPVTPPPLQTESAETFPLGEPEDISEEVIGWAGKTALFPRLATLCFLLVIALILRTITDSGLINTLAGSALGMGYAAALILAGWYQYRRGSPLAPVFAACGATLLSIIVVETHTRFKSLPLIPAYLTLMATGTGMAIISRQFTVFLPVSVGTLGMCLAGAAIDYPEPFFPYLSMILLTANLLGYYAATLKRCSWLRWIVLIVTLAMLQLWGMRLGITYTRRLPQSMALAAAWFLPVIALFTMAYLGIALRGIVRSGSDKVSRFDYSLPTVNVVWFYLMAKSVVSASGGSLRYLGLAALLFALIHCAAGYWLAGRRVAGAPGTNSLLFAGAILLALALPDACGSLLIAIPPLAAVAFALSHISRTWESGGIRLTSYLLQGYNVVALALFFAAAPPSATPLAAPVTAAILAAIALGQYLWCRRQQPPARSIIFSRYDRHDHGAVSLFLGALASAFFALRSVVYQLLPQLSSDLVNSYRCSQSLIINTAAIGLALFAFRQRNKEIRNVAVLVTAVGAVKVFLYDLLGTKGMPLVLSVFSFGLAAAILSIILGRWHAKSAGAAE